MCQITILSSEHYSPKENTLGFFFWKWSKSEKLSPFNPPLKNFGICGAHLWKPQNKVHTIFNFLQFFFRYWKCIDGIPSLETCGNGLAFDDLDPTFTTENCDYIYNVNCGNRSELEPAISANNCPRLYGTFQDETDCTAFFNCRNGLANRYNCAPGLAFDPSDR